MTNNVTLSLTSLPLVSSSQSRVHYLSFRLCEHLTVLILDLEHLIIDYQLMNFSDRYQFLMRPSYNPRHLHGNQIHNGCCHCHTQRRDLI